MPDSFTTAVEFVLSFEQEFSDDPTDPGGVTKWGISQRAYPNLNIRALTRTDAIGIYKSDYWDRCSCGSFPPAIALILFDSAVNQGPNAAIRMMQNGLNVKADGVIGPDTIQAAVQQSHDAAVEFCARRAYQYGVNPLFSRNGLGWSRRLMACLRLALTL